MSTALAFVETPHWLDRICGLGTVAVDQIVFHPDTVSIHAHDQQNVIIEVLNKIGWVSPVIINRTTGYLIDGMARVLAADNQGVTHIPCLLVELEPEEELFVVAFYNSIAKQAIIDLEKLDEAERLLSATPLQSLVETLRQKEAAPLQGTLKRKRSVSRNVPLEQQQPVRKACASGKSTLFDLGNNIRLFGPKPAIEKLIEAFRLPGKKIL